MVIFLLRLKANQYEAGVKYVPKRSSHCRTGAVYQLTKTNNLMARSCRIVLLG